MIQLAEPSAEGLIEAINKAIDQLPESDTTAQHARVRPSDRSGGSDVQRARDTRALLVCRSHGNCVFGKGGEGGKDNNRESIF
eukprot:115858-Chlamydomonas_euryale.AAC.3